MSATERCPRRDFDLLERPEVNFDPFDAYLEFRDLDPFWTNDGGGAWVVTKYAQVREVLQDYRTFTHSQPRVPLDLMPSEYDPPYQTKLRSIVLPFLTSDKVGALAPDMHRVCRELIATFKDQGRCDAANDFARRYPILIFGRLFGLEANRLEDFRQLAETFLHHEDQRADAWNAIRAIINDELQLRRSSPKQDMLTGIAHGQIDGQLIDLDVANNVASTVFLGGLDTLPSNIGWTLRYLTTHHEQRRRISEDASCIPGAVEEFFRRFPSVAKSSALRATRARVEFYGAEIKKGDMVETILVNANCDGDVFPDPLTLDFDRPTNKHIAFSAGSHRCLGSHLARHELAIGLQEWHAAIPDYRIADGQSPRFSAGGVFAVNFLPLEWDI